ncbi:hypothetical protein RJP21_30150 [Paenibacillus sp. VCA1]|uniref:hypothetical protein n=1 Tax=Paenibacillus sp. VCA1 TaxID=3039148 RepID=UPI002872A43A|nr:hypothetical protein [Paenibacillus sp. VCA1]MDR9857859.1 hypothetical protein [Paenibacillus sp. VCA1]
MFNRTLKNREELISVMDALDVLGKAYTIKKEIESVNCPVLGKYDREAWTVMEADQAPEGITVGNLKVKIDIDTSSLEGAIEICDKIQERLRIKGNTCDAK